MKIWKALGIAALAAVVPVRFKKDEDTGIKTFQSLLWKLDVNPKDGENVEIGLDLMDGVLTGPLMDAIVAKQEEADLFTDDPEEAVMHAYDHPDPDAPVLDADEMQDIADEAQDTADEAQEIADEAQAAADKAEEATESDYDSYFF